MVRVQRCNELAVQAWELFDALHTDRQLLPSMSRLRQDNFDLIERLVFNLVL